MKKNILQLIEYYMTTYGYDEDTAADLALYDINP